MKANTRSIGLGLGLGAVLASLLAGCDGRRGVAGPTAGGTGTDGTRPASMNTGAGMGKGAAANGGASAGVVSADKAKEAGTMETAMFGAGCFWGVEETFRRTPGVIETAVGYAGGKTKNPTYKDVCTDETGHAEVVRVVFDPAKVTYGQLLDVFCKGHNPTTLNRQGPDFGSQYRSVVFYYSPEQQKAAQASKEKLAASGKWKKPIVTEISAAPEFYKGEDYHQKYLLNRGLENCHLPDYSDGE